jgi:VanZ family protein
MRQAMTPLFRLFAWLLAATVTFATLGPASYRPHSSLGQDGEHAFAFILIGLAFGVAYSRQRLRASVITMAATGVIEILQLWVPGRHARLEDFAVDAAATCAGFGVVAGLDWMLRRTRPSPT